MAAAANAPSRVGIIGAGIAAAACARALAAVGVRSTVYEQGRSAGGRLATRRSRARKGKHLAINHGAPAFTARGPEFKRMVAALEAEGAVEEWSDATLGILHQQRGLEIVKPPGLRLYRGRPTMSALAEKMLATSAPFCDQHYGDLIQHVSLDPAPVDAQQRWRLSTRSGAYSNHEFLVVASSLPASSGRWKGIFGDDAEAPLVEALSSALAAAEASTGPAAGQQQQQQLEELQAAASAIASVGSVPTQPVLSVMVAWGGTFGPEAAAYAEAWLPCELMEVKDHPVLQKVVRQPQPDGGVALILHSTHEFAAAHPKAYGRQSSVATSGMLDPDLAATAAAMEEGVARENLLQWFNCGRWALVQRDIRAVLPDHIAAAAIGVCERHGVADAFAIRRELVNYKKAMLHSRDAAHRLEKDLRQLVAFFRRVEYEEGGAYFRHVEPHASLCDALADCTGVLAGLQDGRDCSKAVCSVGRWPGAARTGKLLKLPLSLKSVTLLRKAEHFLAASASGDGPAALHPHEVAPEPEPAPAVWEPQVDGDDPDAATSTWQALLGALATTGVCSSGHSDGGGADGRSEWAAHILHYIQQVLIVRGAAKALRMRYELERYGRCLTTVASRAEATLSALEGRSSIEAVQRALDTTAELGAEGKETVKIEGVSVASGRSFIGSVALSRATHGARHRCIVAALLSTLRESTRWAARIAATREGDPLLFLSGDCDAQCSTTMFVPGGFNASAVAALEAARSGILTHQLTMQRALAADGWPPWLEMCAVPSDTSTDDNAAAAAATPATLRARAKNKAKGRGKGRENDPHRCVLCSAVRPTLWIHRGVCFECDRQSRVEGRCPYATQNSHCDPRLFCTHSSGGDNASGGGDSAAAVGGGGKCLLCDAMSCTLCRFYRGDGEEVTRLAHALRPSQIFLDWDRTFCSTRGGGSPLNGAHTLDAELHALLQDHPGRVHVVTRNSYRADITEFLRRHGVQPSEVAVHTVKKGESKAQVVCAAPYDDTVVRTTGTTHAAGSSDGGGGRRRRVVLFVDDSIEEHLQLLDAMADHDATLEVHRVLFVRGVAV